MSLINQMLQDLEKRRASGAERGMLPNQVRVLPREEARSMPWWLIGIGAGAALIAVLAWQFNNTRAPASSTALIAQAPQDAQSRAIPPTPGSPASRLALDLEKVPPRPPRKPAQSPLATDVVVSAEPEVKPRVAPAEIKAVKQRPAATSVETAKVASVAPAAPAVVVVPGRPATFAPGASDVVPESKVRGAAPNVQIDKRVQTLTPQQLAENEYREAASFLNQGRLVEAQEGFTRALQHNPAHVGARQGLFGLLLEAKKIPEAEQVLQEGLKLNPNQPGFAMALASLQYERGNISDAIETMQKSAPAAQASPDYLARLAGLLQRQSRHREAIENYQAALRLAPGSGVWLMGLGISLQALNRNAEAQEAFRRARTSNTLSPELQAFVDQRLKQLQ